MNGQLDRVENALAMASPNDVLERVVGSALQESSVHTIVEYLALRTEHDRLAGLDHLVPTLGSLSRLGLATQTTAAQPLHIHDPQRGVWVCEVSAGSKWRARLNEVRDALGRLNTSSEFMSLLYAAMVELVANAEEHGQGSLLPVFAAVVRNGAASFSVTDVGPGVLASMRRAHPDLTRGPEALRLSLIDGNSGTGELGRGNGYRALFQALAGRRVRLRFRSSTATIGWTATNPDRQNMPCSVLPNRTGYHVELAIPHLA